MDEKGKEGTTGKRGQPGGPGGKGGTGGEGKVTGGTGGTGGQGGAGATSPQGSRKFYLVWSISFALLFIGFLSTVWGLREESLERRDQLRQSDAKIEIESQNTSARICQAQNDLRTAIRLFLKDDLMVEQETIDIANRRFKNINCGMIVNGE